MALDVEPPEPPDLSNRGRPRAFEWDEETLGSEDFHREDLEDLLQEGAWMDGFTEWAEYTDLEADEVRAVSDLGLFRAFDFFWDPTDDLLRFQAPTVPDDWQTREATGFLDAGTVSVINSELQDLGRTVQETLEQYLEREDTFESTRAREAYGDREE